CSWSGSVAVRSSRIISKAIIERRRRFCGRDFLLDMLIAPISYQLPFDLRLFSYTCLPLKLWRSPATNLILRERVVRIAIQPALARLRGSDHGMCGCPRMFAGVLIWGAVATKRNATRLARAQMNPARTDLHAFFTFAALRLLDRFNRVEMRTASVGHHRMSLSRPRTRATLL